MSESELAALADSLERERILTDLEYLSRKYLMTEDWNPKLHGEIARVLSELRPDETQVVEYPPGFLKSTVISQNWCVQQILRNRNIRIGIVSAGWSKAMEICTVVKAHLQHPELVRLFPEVLFANPENESSFWRADRFNVKKDPQLAGYTMKVNGIFGTIGGEHFEIMILDDPHDAENTETGLQIEKVIMRWKMHRTRLEPGGLAVIVGYPWKVGDLFTWCEGMGYKILKRTATVDEHGEPCPVTDRGAASTFPEKFSVEFLLLKRKELGGRLYAMQYEMRLVADADIEFRQKDISFAARLPGPKETRAVWFLNDPAMSLARRSDPSALVVVVCPREGAPICVKALELRLRVRGLIDRIYAEYDSWAMWGVKPQVAIEEVGFSGILQQWMEEDFTKGRHPWFKVTPLRTEGRRKETRIRALQPMLENTGLVFLEKDTAEIRKQLLMYGTTPKDDLVDALAYFLDVWKVGGISVVSDLYRQLSNRDPNSLEAQIAQMEGNDFDRDWRDL